MNVPQYARYNRTVHEALAFLVNEGIKVFPFDPIDVISRHKWTLLTYAEFIMETGNTRKATERINQDGFAIFADGKYSIIYNEKVTPGRVRFTLTHEIAHIILHHFEEFDKCLLYRNGLTPGENKVLDNEANCFARNVLAPAPIVLKLKKANEKRRAKIFGVTNAFWATRKELLIHDLAMLKMPDIRNIRAHFMVFLYGRICANCKSCFIATEGSKHCPICGGDKLRWRYTHMEYADGFEVDESGRAHICPRCSNSEIKQEGSYCKICGANIVNSCINDGNEYDSCGRPAEGNARYCVYCGAETTFFRDGFLVPWDGTPTEKPQTIFVEEDDKLPF